MASLLEMNFDISRKIYELMGELHLLARRWHHTFKIIIALLK